MSAAVVYSVATNEDGYWDRLASGVRAEFRVDDYRPAEGDPVLRLTKAASCPVPGCRSGTAPAKAYCGRHWQLWAGLGEPPSEEFLTTVPPSQPAKRAGSSECAVDSCENAAATKGWCRLHYVLWQRRGRPDDFAATAGPVPAIPSCRVSDCRRPEAAAVYGLCDAHRRMWKAAGSPALEGFVGKARAVQRVEKIYSFSRLPPGPKLELQFALQQRHDAGAARTTPSCLAVLVETIVGHDPDCRSILDRPLEEWERLLAASTGIRPAQGNRGVLYRAFLRWSYGELSLLGDLDPFLPDRWDVRRVKPDMPSRNRWVDWSGIPQPWLREAAKRWGRVRITTQGAATVTRDAYHLTDFAGFLREHTSVQGSADITRRQIEGYIGHLGTKGASEQARSRYLGTLRQFLTAACEQKLLTLHPSATVRLGDLPATARVLPRFLPDRVMAVLEAPESLALLPDLARNLVKVLMGTGRRASEGCTLAFDSLVDGPDGEPYLRYFAGKIRKEQMIPLDPTTAAAIRDQQVQVLRLWPEGSSWLFPRPRCNPFGRYPMRYETLKYALRRWVRDLDLRESLPTDAPLGAEAPLVDLTSHRFRHTIATRMINEDVPACVVQRFLDHDSPAMTQRYIAVHDKTLREAFDRYRHRVTSEGRVIVYERESPMSEGMRLAERLKRARQTLANGYCARPMQTDCIHPNFCHGCTQFVSDVTFLPVLRGQRDRATKMRDRCVEEDRPKWAKRNERDVVALKPIIAALEALPEAADFAP